MSQPSDLEARVAALEARVDVVAADATAARHLAAARDRDLADLGVKVDANRLAINALGQQTAGFREHVDRRFAEVDRRFDAIDRRFDEVDHRFAEVDRRFDEVDRQFAEMRGTFDQFAAGQQRIVEMLTTLADRQGEH